MSTSTRFLLAAVALAALAACGESVPAQVAKPWKKESECGWWLSGADGKSLRASISQGSDGLILTLADPVFRSWSETDRPLVELRFDKQAGRRAIVEGWVSLGDDAASMFGLYLDGAARKAMDRATMLELSRDGKLVLTMPLAGTPAQAELDACVPPPSSEESDSE
ncbi:MAG: hypothetical protein ACKVRO_12850 [Micropepsaceae bacterium]